MTAADVAGLLTLATIAQHLWVSAAHRSFRRIGRAVIWPVARPHRLLALAWVHGLMIVGGANAAMAAEPMIIAPDLGAAGGATFFERYADVSAYDVPLDTDSDHDQLDEPQWAFLNGMTNVVLYLTFTLMRGAIVAFQWVLSLDFYSDQRTEVDRVVAELNDQVFLPLVGTTLAIGAFLIFTRGKRDGRDSYFSELAWMIVAALFAFLYMAQPSRVLDVAHGASTSVADTMMSTYATAASGEASAAGPPAVDTGDTTDGAIRSISDSLWNVYVTSTWCHVAWGSMDACAIVGEAYLIDSEASDGAWGSARLALEDDGDVEPFAGNTSWVRGQEHARFGAALLLGGVTAIAALMLLALAFFALLAIIGLVFLALVGCVFLAGWVIPGLPRRIGIGWLHMQVGTLIQALLVVTIIGTVMTLSAFLNASLGTYGVLGVALLNVAVLMLGLRFRAQFEQLLGMGTAATGGSVMSSYMAARMIGGGAKMGSRLMSRGARGSWRGGKAAAAGIVGGSYKLGESGGKAYDKAKDRAQGAMARLAPLPAGTGRGSTTADRAKTVPATGGTAPTTATSGSTSTTSTSAPSGSSPKSGSTAAPSSQSGTVTAPGGQPATSKPSTPKVTMPPPLSGPKKAPPSRPRHPVGGPVSQPAGRPAPTAASGGSKKPPTPPPSSAPRMAAPIGRPAPVIPGGSKKPPPAAPSTAQPRMAAPRRYTPAPLTGGDQK